MSTGQGLQTTEFKFRWLDDNGKETGFFGKKGHFDGEILKLDDVEIPAAAILHIETRDKFMAVSLMTEGGEPANIAFSVAGGRCKRIKSLVNVARSASWAQFNREALEKEGRGHQFRAEQCPHCTATLILSGMPSTPQLYCHFCDSLITTEDSHEAPPSERLYKICDECGMYSMPRKYTIFYFYFLLVFYGYHQRTTWRCPGCMRGEAWKMFFGNLLFVLGVIPAIVQLARSYGGSISGPFAGLDAANIRARRGNVAAAIKTYEAIMQRVPYCAGIKYNIGSGLMRNNDYERASQILELALDDCTNYSPAYGALVQCYQQLGESQKLTALKQQWDDVDDEPEPPPQQ